VGCRAGLDAVEKTNSFSVRNLNSDFPVVQYVAWSLLSYPGSWLRVEDDRNLKSVFRLSVRF
jgi:hypothetical protein